MRNLLRDLLTTWRIAIVEVIILVLVLASCVQQLPSFMVPIPAPTDTPLAPPIESWNVSPTPTLPPLATDTNPLDSLPIHLNWTDVPYDFFRTALDAAEAMWNKALGQTIFDDKTRANSVKVSWVNSLESYEPDSYTTGMTTFEPDGSILVQFWVMDMIYYPSEYTIYVAAHELGHVIGCQHTVGINDVMRAEILNPNGLSPSDIAQAETWLKSRGLIK